jgi:NADH-quinone oxidoreductase subunit J
MPNFIFFTFASIILIGAFFLVKVFNPVYSVLLLVLVFLDAAALFFMLQLEFLPLVFVFVYIGAIAILFLFVVMMLEIKTITKNIYINSFPFRSFIRSFFISLIIFELFSLLKKCFISLNYDNFSGILNSSAFTLDKITNIESLGQLLYTYFFLYFLIIAMVLLVSMLGAIVLTLQYNKYNKTQLFFKQFSRNSYNAIFLIKV